MSNNKLTDNLLAQLFIEFKKDYKALANEGKGVNAIAQQIGNNLYYSLQRGHLKNLDPVEKRKAYQVLETLIQSMPEYQNLPAEKKRIEIPTTYTEIHNYYDESYYCNHPDPWLTWLVLSNLSRSSTGYANYSQGAFDSHHHGRKRKDDEGDPWAQLILVVIVGALVMSAFVLAFFALRELIDCGDRIFYNEGTLRALLSMSIMAASGVAGAFIGSVLLKGPLIALAIAAGFSPAGVVFIATIALTMIGSGIVGLLFSHFKLQEYFIRNMNKDAIDPAEPQRFSLTPEQEQNLKQNGISVLKVKCALTAIRGLMDSHVHDRLWRWFTTEGDKHQKLLEKVRDLKDGKIHHSIKVGDMTIELHETNFNQDVTSGTDNLPQPYIIAPPSAPTMDQLQQNDNREGANQANTPTYQYPSLHQDSYNQNNTSSISCEQPVSDYYLLLPNSHNQNNLPSTSFDQSESRYKDLFPN